VWGYNGEDFELQNFMLIQQQLTQMKFDIKLMYLKNKYKYILKYKFYKLLKIFSIGEKRKNIKEKIRKYKKNLKIIKEI
jgi:hypothetical protein